MKRTITSLTDNSSLRFLFPRNQVGCGSLVVQLEVDTREKEGWQEEEVMYSSNSVYREDKIHEYKLYREKNAWADAEAHCKGQGGHLASVLSEEEQQALTVKIDDMSEEFTRRKRNLEDRPKDLVEKEEKISKSIWLGGSNQEKDKTWRLSDGSTWNYAHWSSLRGNRARKCNCVRIGGSSNEWVDHFCKLSYPIICQSPVLNMSGKTKKTLTYTQKQLTFNFLIDRYSYTCNHFMLDSWEDKRMTGFCLSWRIEPPPLEKTLYMHCVFDIKIIAVNISNCMAVRLKSSTIMPGSYLYNNQLNIGLNNIINYHMW